jgi:hypothetical protein
MVCSQLFAFIRAAAVCCEDCYFRTAEEGMSLISVRFSLALLVCAFSGLQVSCGGQQNQTTSELNQTRDNCSPTGVVITPASGMADHMASAPGNQVHYMAAFQVPAGCVPPPTPNPLVTWSTSDPLDTTIDASGLATCVNATSQPATIKGTRPDGSFSATAVLACK